MAKAEYTALHRKSCCCNICRCCDPCCAPRTNRAIMVLLILSAIFLIAGTLFPWGLRKFVQSGIEDQYVIDGPSATGFSDWQDSRKAKAPQYYKITAMNITNPDDVLKGAKPHIQEIGPYVYSEISVKKNVTWDDDGDIVNYWDQHYYVFEPELSGEGLSDTDLYTNINFVLQGLWFALPGMFTDMKSKALGTLTWQSLLKTLMCRAHANQPDEHKHFEWHSPFMRRSVKEMYFGYTDDPLLIELNKIAKMLKATANISIPLQLTTFPGLENNYTDENGIFPVYKYSNINRQYTGKKDFSKAREYILWENQTSAFACPTIPCPLFQTEWEKNKTNTRNKYGWWQMWETLEAGDVTTKDGTYFKFGVEKNSVLSLFIDTIFRSVGLKNMDGETTDDVHGIELLRFRIQHKDLLNASLSKANAVYDSNGPSGMLNLTTPSQFPLFITKPAFLDGSPSLIEGIDGMTQSRDDDTYLDVEPNTGITMRERKQLQLNGVIQDWSLTHGPHISIPGWDDCGDGAGMEEWDGHWGVKEPIYTPYIVIREETEISSDDASTFKGSALAAYDAADALEIWSNVAAGLCFLVALVLIGVKLRRKSSHAQMQMESTEATDLPRPPVREQQDSSDDVVGAMARHSQDDAAEPYRLLDCMEEE